MIAVVIVAVGIAAMAVSGISGNDTKNKTVIESTGELKDGKFVYTQNISIPEGQVRSGIENMKDGKLKFAWGEFSSLNGEGEIRVGVQTINSKYFDCDFRGVVSKGKPVSVVCVERGEPLDAITSAVLHLEEMR